MTDDRSSPPLAICAALARIEAAKAHRTAAALHIRITGLDMPPEGFDAYAATEAQRNAWIATYQGNGYTVDVVNP